MNKSRKTIKKETYFLTSRFTGNFPDNLSEMMRVQFCRKRHKIFRTAYKTGKLPF